MAAPTISSGRPMRPNGTSLSRTAAWPGDLGAPSSDTRPGTKAFTRTAGASSAAKQRVINQRAALLAPYGIVPRTGRNPAPDRTLMMEPPVDDAIIAGAY